MFSKALIAGSMPIPPPDLSIGLTNHWLLNSLGDDIKGSNDLSNVGVSIKGDRYYYTNSTSYSDIQSTALNGTQFTISLWFQLDYTVVNHAKILSTGALKEIQLLVLEMGALQIQAGGVAKRTVDTTYLTGLHHVIATYDSSTSSFTLTVNGQDKSITSASTKVNASRTALAVGWTLSSYGLKGWLSNVRLYNGKIVSTEEKAALYAEGYYPKLLPAPPVLGLVAHYPLTGTADDTTGSYNATETGGLTYYDSPTFGSVTQKLSGYAITSANSPASINGTSPRTITAWIYTGVAAAVNNVIFTYGVDTTGNKVIITVDSTTHALRVAFTGGYRIGTTAINNNAWRFVSITFPSGGTTSLHTKLYVDAILETISSELSVAVNTLASPMIIGESIGATAGDFDGYIRNLRIYNYELSQTELAAIMEYEKNYRFIDIDDGLLSFYPLKKNAFDNFKTQLDATATGGVTYNGAQATIPTGNTITFPAATGFVEAYYTINGVVTKTTTESSLNSLTNCTLKNVRKYNRALTVEQQAIIGYTI